MGVNFVCGELLNETLGLVQGQKLGYTDTHKSCLFLKKKKAEVMSNDNRMSLTMNEILTGSLN